MTATGYLGYYPAKSFDIADGEALASRLPPPAAWYFSGEIIAVPQAGLAQAKTDRQTTWTADLRAWARQRPVTAGSDYPPLVWLAAATVLRDVHLLADGTLDGAGDGLRTWTTVPRLASNGAWIDASTFAFFRGRPQKLRGNAVPGAFCVRTWWPADFRLPAQPELAPLQPGRPATFPATMQAVHDWVRALPHGGAQAPFSAAAIWQRMPGMRLAPGQPVFGVLLNGAQGDDDEAHAGHFAVLTGVVGEQGAIDDWLVYNFYTLDAESEKGIIAAPVPLDNYLADLNAGQAWYRPSCLLVATLRDARLVDRLQSAFARVFSHFYCHRFAYQHARANCAGISLRTLRAIGWRLPRLGAERRLAALLALPWLLWRERSWRRGKALFDYLSEERSSLYPAVAFEVVVADLLQRLSGESTGTATSFERCLSEDIEQLLLLRVPQLPSSRPFGDWPVASSDEYRARMPADPAQKKIIPVAPRPFPAALRDPRLPRELPLRSDFAVALWALLLSTGLLLIALPMLSRLLA